MSADLSIVYPYSSGFLERIDAVPSSRGLNENASNKCLFSTSSTVHLSIVSLLSCGSPAIKLPYTLNDPLNSSFAFLIVSNITSLGHPFPIIFADS